MVRPCSCPASDGSWPGAPKTRSTPCLRTPNAAIAVVGIDIGKNSFHVVGLDQRGAIGLRQKWSRGQVDARLANMPPCLIGMEACVGAHHLSRRLKALGHDTRLMPARYVRPYWKGQKNDFRDAEAIAEAVQRPTMKFVATKTAEQLDLQALHRVRERLVSQRTGIINQIRAFLLERGVAVRQGLRFLRVELPRILATRPDVLSPRMVGTGFDPHKTWLEVSHVPLESPPRQLLAHDHFPTRIHSNEVKATLAEIHSDCSDTVIVRNDVSHGALLSRISCASAALPFTR